MEVNKTAAIETIPDQRFKKSGFQQDVVIARACDKMGESSKLVSKLKLGYHQT